MGYKIIYKQEDGSIAVCFPADGNADFDKAILVGKLSAPEGSPFKVITQDDFPSSLELQEAWELDDEEFTDGVGLSEEEKLAIYAEMGV